MKILFLCASLDPGKDGVGDYTTRLASELEAIGKKCFKISINDRHITDGLGVCAQSNKEARQLRLGPWQSWQERLIIAQKTIQEFKPDWVSLQFVGYGFDPRGLPFGLAQKLRTIAAGIPWHVMFHELWIEPKGGWKDPILSRLQKALHVDLCRSLRSKMVHTSNDNYARRLAEAGISATVLPLFSNIECVAPDPTLRQSLVREITPGLDDKDIWIFIFFGTIHPSWDFGILLQRISAEAGVSGKKAIFISIGKNPPSGDVTWRKMEACGAANCKFLKLGELSAKEISQILGSADFGVATTPSSLLGKSGSFAAMATHGLPVIVPRNDGSPGLGASVEQGIILVNEMFGKKLLHPIRPTGYPGPRDVVSCWARQFESFCE